MIIIFFLLLFSISEIACDCTLYKKCGDCIGNGKNCVWCAEERILPISTRSSPRDSPRCMPSNIANNSTWCNKALIVNPQSDNKTITDNAFNDTVQFRPQHITMKIRPGQTRTFKMSYLPAKDYPLDIYFMMDISDTMKAIKDELRDQAKNIYFNLKNYTNNVRFGIGTFVDKPVFPLVDKYKSKDDTPVHSFENLLPLTDVSTDSGMYNFTSTVDNIKFAVNYDDPEAGMDALMQAMKCEHELKWRDRARRIIILYTDSTYHSAGDGKIVGAYKPNDMKCHLAANVYKDEDSLTYDYPSVSQINKVAKEGSFIIIFAAAPNLETEYQLLSNQIVGAEYASLINKTNVVDLIKDTYLKKANSLQLNYNLPPWVDLTLNPDCTKEQDNNTNVECKSTPENRTVNIEGILTVTYCPKEGEFNSKIEVKVIGINESLIIDLETVCKCDCEKENKKPSSPSCSNAGFLQCGICKCDTGRTGLNCHCHGTSSDYDNSMTESCKLEAADTTLCSSRGNCSCGVCMCNPGFSGDVCQYDDNKCYFGGMKCFGHGSCEKEKCECQDDWSGTYCTCDMKSTSCIAPYSDKVCSGNGICNCGKCICNEVPGKNESVFSGKYCEICDDCVEERCKELSVYVLCNVANEKCDHKLLNTTQRVTVKFMNKTEMNGPDWKMAPQCKAQLENNSLIIFKYESAGDTYKLGIQTELEPAPKADILVGVGSAIGLVLLIGILTLIVWKILVDIHDKKEFEKFYQESKDSGYEVTVNPIFQESTTHFQNPAFVECTALPHR